MHRLPSVTRSLALATVLVAALGACSKGAVTGEGSSGATATATTPEPSGPTGGGASASAGGDHGGGTNGSSTGDGSQGNGDDPAQPSTDDLRVFGFATSDEGQLAGEVARVSDTVARLSSDIAVRDVSASQADAAALLDEAKTLETDADDATKRQRPLDPADQTLVKARAHAIDAFGTTAAYAATVAGLAEAALDLNLQELASVAQQAAALQGTGAEIEASYEALNRELTAWAQDHPAEAAEALARFAT
jgi:hypothetical protein